MCILLKGFKKKIVQNFISFTIRIISNRIVIYINIIIKSCCVICHGCLLFSGQLKCKPSNKIGKMNKR